MRRFAVLLLCFLLVCLLGGCQSRVQKEPAVEVTIDGDGVFPDFLVGRWKADRGGWEFVFEPGGTISSAVVSVGRVTMKPGQTTTVPMQMGGKGVFEPGRWAVQYSHAQRELIVEIVIKHFHVELGDNVLRGRTRDFFVGSVSNDGQLWPTERISFPEYIADTKKYPNRKLVFDPNDNARESLLFQKVLESK
ncbi:MAG: hypothetical protein A2Z25_02420 [Planctomycetes bacterium RBG_16_55_9]|nr:MAG: hypothetical protein A2Z25_02420 [Planctomycetes bacterium RBG_16_55_9]